MPKENCENIMDVLSAFLEQIESLSKKLDRLENHLIINNNLASKAGTNKVASTFERIMRSAYQDCHDFNDFVKTIKAKKQRYNIDDMREWYDEECARLR